jgi:PST family polysaccharide transporter
MSGMLWTFTGTGVQALVQLLTIMVLGRLLTPAEFGLMGAATVVIGASQIVSQIGVGPAIIQRKELVLVHVRSAVTLSLVLGLLLGTIVYFGAGAIAAFYRMPELEPILRVISFLFPMDGLNTVARSILTRELRFRLFVALDVGSFVVGYAVVAVILASVGMGVWALVIANLAQEAVRTIAMYLATRHPLRPSLNVKAAGDLLSFGFGHSLAQIGTLVSQEGDNMVVGRYLGATALGVYDRAYTLMVMPANLFGKIVNRVLFPVMAMVQDEVDRLATAYERALAVVALVSLPVSSLLWVVAPEFIPTLLGPQWGSVVLPFRLFTLSLLFRMSSKISDACTKAAGAVYSRAMLQWGYAALVVLGALLGLHWGVGGVAVAVSIAMAANWLTMAELGRRVTGLSWGRFVRAHMPGVLLAVLIGGAAFLGVRAARASECGVLPTLAAGLLAAAAAMLLVLKLEAEPFLGPHGSWAVRQGAQLYRQVLERVDSRRAVEPTA